MRPPRQFREADDLHAIVMMGDISDFKQAEVGYQRLNQELGCLACHERGLLVVSQEVNCLGDLLRPAQSTTAAVIALGDVALRRPDSARAIIGELVSRLKQPMTPVWYQCYVQPARWMLLRLMSPS